MAKKWLIDDMSICSMQADGYNLIIEVTLEGGDTEELEEHTVSALHSGNLEDGFQVYSAVMSVEDKESLRNALNKSPVAERLLTMAMEQYAEEMDCA